MFGCSGYAQGEQQYPVGGLYVPTKFRYVIWKEYKSDVPILMVRCSRDGPTLFMSLHTCIVALPFGTKVRMLDISMTDCGPRSQSTKSGPSSQSRCSRRHG